MAARSPNYPAIDLLTALMSISDAWKAENRNKMSRLVLAKHLGYNSLNGRALGRIGAVRAYGLVEGRGDELRVSEDAITALAAPEGSPARREALERLALQPSLFNELRSEFPGTLPSEENVKFQLAKRGLTAKAAGKAAQTYLNTMRYVSGEPVAINPQSNSDLVEESMQAHDIASKKPTEQQRTLPARAGILQEIFSLQEGPVSLSYPAELSEESYADLKDQLELFLRRAQRRASLTARYKDPAYLEMRRKELERRAAQPDPEEE